MAEAARIALKADIGVGITGVEETEARPTGVVYIGVSDGKSGREVTRPLGKRRVTATALLELRKLLIAVD